MRTTWGRHENQCPICGTRSFGEPAPGGWVPRTFNNCADCLVVEERFPDIFAWVKKVVDNAVDRHELNNNHPPEE